MIEAKDLAESMRDIIQLDVPGEEHWPGTREALQQAVDKFAARLDAYIDQRIAAAKEAV